MFAKKTALIMIASAFIVSASICGCADKEPMTVERLMDSNIEAREQVEKSVEAMSSDDMDTAIYYDKNSIIIVGTLQTAFSENVLGEMKKTFDKSSLSAEKTYADIITQIEDSTKIEGVKIKTIVSNGDGTPIWEKEFEGKN